MLCEQIGPVGGPLLVLLQRPSLAGDPGREDDDVRELDERGDDRRGTMRLEHVHDLEAEREVEPPQDRERLVQVGADELRRRDEELRAVDPGAVVAEHVLDAEPLEDRQPLSQPATDIGDALRVRRLEDQRNRDVGGLGRAREPPAVVQLLEVLQALEVVPTRKLAA